MTMDKMILADYVDRVYGWSVRHTFSCDEADELSQEILLTAPTAALSRVSGR